jgi:hypothetical protein
LAAFINHCCRWVRCEGRDTRKQVLSYHHLNLAVRADIIDLAPATSLWVQVKRFMTPDEAFYMAPQVYILLILHTPAFAWDAIPHAPYNLGS